VASGRLAALQSRYVPRDPAMQSVLASAIPLLYALLLAGGVALLADIALLVQARGRRRLEAELEAVSDQLQVERQRAVAAETRVEAQEAGLVELRPRAGAD